jgi:transposase InsO family protein
VHETDGFSILLLCDIAGIPRSSYYKWRKRPKSAHEVENEELLKEMARLFEKVEGIYGYRRMALNLRRMLNRRLNRKRVHRLMRLGGMKSVIRRKKKSYVYISPQQIAENLLNRQFSADSSNEKWLTDVTELPYDNGRKAYLSAILDLHDKRIVSHVLGQHNDNPLVYRTLQQAQETAPDSSPLLHSDRGSQYTSRGFKVILDTQGMAQSMSRAGKCIDNGPMEGFWGTLKCESYYLHRHDSFESVQKDVDRYIQFYNENRPQENLGGLSPEEFRSQTT